MKTGALIFAFDNEHTKYLDMAAWTAERVHRHLNIPVSVVTNCPKQASALFDCVIETDSGDANQKFFQDHNNQLASWHNSRRTDAYALTPYDQTLVLDADYVINSAILATYFDAPADFLCYKDAFHVGQKDGEFMTDHNSFGRYNFPMWWATVMLFRKSSVSSYIFDCMNMVRENWKHYMNLYNIPNGIYRNDFALSIALGLVSGHTLAVDVFKESLPTVLPTQRLIQLDQDMWSFEWQQGQRMKSSSVAGLDFHAMCKRDLGEIIAAYRRTRLCDTSS